MTDRLRGLWNFDDLDGTEQCLHAQLDQETTDSGRAELLAMIEEEAERLDRFVADLLNMTRLESGALETKVDWIDVAEPL